MNITDSKLKIYYNGNKYTLLQKDEAGKIKIRGENIVTKQELIDNSPTNISYKDDIKIYCYLNGERTELAVKENIEYLSSSYTLLFNNTNSDIIYDPDICVANDDNISLILQSTDEQMHVINYNTESELEFNSTTQNSLSGSMISIINLDISKNTYDLSDDSIEENYILNNITNQLNRSTLSYTQVEVI